MPNPVPHDRRTLTLRERLQITWFTWKYSGTRRMEVLDDWMDDHDPSALEGLKAYVEQREARLHRGGEALCLGCVAEDEGSINELPFLDDFRAGVRVERVMLSLAAVVREADDGGHEVALAHVEMTSAQARELAGDLTECAEQADGGRKRRETAVALPDETDADA